MKLYEIIRRNECIKNRQPIKLIELEKFINTYPNREQDYSKSAIRNIFIGNDDYYSFKYKATGWGKYIPIELNSSRTILNEIADDYIEDGITLKHKLGLTFQNTTKESWILFCKRTKQKERFLTFFPELECEFIDIEKNLIKIFKSLLKLAALNANESEEIKEYIFKNKISIEELVKWIKTCHMNQPKRNGDSINNIFDLKSEDNPWNRFSTNNEVFSKIILKGVEYANYKK